MKKIFIFASLIGISLSSWLCLDDCASRDCAGRESYAELCIISGEGDTLTKSQQFVDEELELSLLEEDGDTALTYRSWQYNTLRFKLASVKRMTIELRYLGKADTLSFSQSHEADACCGWFYRIIPETIRFNNRAESVDFRHNIFYLTLD